MCMRVSVVQSKIQHHNPAKIHHTYMRIVTGRERRREREREKECAIKYSHITSNKKFLSPDSNNGGGGVGMGCGWLQEMLSKLSTA